MHRNMKVLSTLEFVRDIRGLISKFADCYYSNKPQSRREKALSRNWSWTQLCMCIKIWCFSLLPRFTTVFRRKVCSVCSSQCPRRTKLPWRYLLRGVRNITETMWSGVCEPRKSLQVVETFQQWSKKCQHPRTFRENCSQENLEKHH